MKLMKLIRPGLSTAVLCSFVFSALAQAESLSPKETYLKYRSALLSAKTVNEIMPFMCKKVQSEIESTPQDMKPMIFGLIKETTPSSVQVISEEIDGDSANLKLSSAGSQTPPPGAKSIKEDTKGSVKLLKENGVWKIDKESWESKVEIH
ncbi:MAG: hypothetical protein K2X27_21035 [Candidatus Obscuribacterales bacterium]|nr:hypothetical protein [Candidatus Obscuribacterales bacterium]